ncbi:uncharacterized protein LOC121431376 [Lytechinus variegatus]|uniref:uncharacterized protein LOC121431376 n=1 Tax=Lytechinus variegatus TaxID=7654 RepID=UPI001BB23675|nr:uncharacterized protein LOC121431376 [Lytechinus variegatus]
MVIVGIIGISRRKKSRERPANDRADQEMTTPGSRNPISQDDDTIYYETTFSNIYSSVDKGTYPPQDTHQLMKTEDSNGRHKDKTLDNATINNGIGTDGAAASGTGGHETDGMIDNILYQPMDRITSV